MEVGQGGAAEGATEGGQGGAAEGAMEGGQGWSAWADWQEGSKTSSIEKAKTKKKVAEKIPMPLDSPAMSTRSRKFNPPSPAMSTRSKRRLSL
ncbi:hypothetical protein D1007_33269 [Hordeum vulgare]|nr:hypothetical protein D1007_33269 [Hordeum vulgare]